MNRNVVSWVLGVWQGYKVSSASTSRVCPTNLAFSGEQLRERSDRSVHPLQRRVGQRYWDGSRSLRPHPPQTIVTFSSVNLMRPSGSLDSSGRTILQAAGVEISWQS